MAPPPLATLDDFETWPGVVLASGQEQSAEAVLAAVSARVRDVAGETWVNDENELEDVPDAILGIVLGIALRVWVNPDAKSQTASGPFSVAWTLGGLVLTPEEKAAITRATGGTLWPGIGTLATGRGPLETPNVDSCAGGVHLEIPWP